MTRTHQTLPGGTVVGYVVDPTAHASAHERQTLSGFVHQLAQLRGACDGGLRDRACGDLAGPVYYVPTVTLQADQARALGIGCAKDLYGGVVPHGFVASKAISHPLLHEAAARPPGWVPKLAAHLGDAALDGYSAFDPGEALAAGVKLLALGPVRVKPVRGTGGRGQSVARDEAALAQALAAIGEAEITRHGVVLERNLEQVHTYSVGRIQVGELVASYVGTQRLTRSNQGEEVFGGSDLTVVRGELDALDRLNLQPDERDAIERARRYEAAVRACHPDLWISRSNYDVARGVDPAGAWHCGVLEQSWRIGGATGPELAALAHFQRQPQAWCVRASCWELFGDAPQPPDDATVYWRGDDPDTGPLTKYTRLLGSEGRCRES